MSNMFTSAQVQQLASSDSLALDDAPLLLASMRHFLAQRLFLPEADLAACCEAFTKALRRDAAVFQSQNAHAANVIQTIVEVLKTFNNPRQEPLHKAGCYSLLAFVQGHADNQRVARAAGAPQVLDAIIQDQQVRVFVLVENRLTPVCLAEPCSIRV